MQATDAINFAAAVGRRGGQGGTAVPGRHTSIFAG